MSPNALVDILVFGEIAGREAARHASRSRVPNGRREGVAEEIARIERLFDVGTVDALPTAPMRRRHIEWMDTRMGVLRNPDGMREMLDEIIRTREEELPRLRVFDRSRVYNFELRDALEMFYRLDVEEMATRAALLRTESRGGHYREDFPRRNDREWVRNIVWFRRDGELHYDVRPVPQTVIRIDEIPAYAAQDSPWP